MAAQYRPGDRSRRDDDRYLFLEAVLSARQRLRISWLGRSVHDNSEREPSVLVAQLRQHLAQGWQLAPEAGDDLLVVLTEDFPLKPYSQRYLSGELQTWQREWRSFYQPAAVVQADDVLPLQAPDQPLDLTQLADFLRDPVRCFFQQRLQVYFPAQTASHQDDEAFALDGLSNWQLQQQLYSALSQQIRLDPAQGGVHVVTRDLVRALRLLERHECRVRHHLAGLVLHVELHDVRREAPELRRSLRVHLVVVVEADEALLVRAADQDVEGVHRGLDADALLHRQCGIDHELVLWIVGGEHREQTRELLALLELRDEVLRDAVELLVARVVGLIEEPDGEACRRAVAGNGGRTAGIGVARRHVIAVTDVRNMI